MRSPGPRVDPRDGRQVVSGVTLSEKLATGDETRRILVFIESNDVRVRERSICRDRTPGCSARNTFPPDLVRSPELPNTAGDPSSREGRRERLAAVGRATVLQPAALISQMAVEQADGVIKNGKPSKPEKQSIDCILVIKSNADEFGVFAKK